MKEQIFIYRPKTENFMPDALKDGEEIVFICGMNKPSENAKGFGRYARPSEKWNTHIVNKSELEALELIEEIPLFAGTMAALNRVLDI